MLLQCFFLFFSFSSFAVPRVNSIPRPGDSIVFAMKAQEPIYLEEINLHPDPLLNQVAISGYVLGLLHSVECKACSESDQSLCTNILPSEHKTHRV